MKPIKHMFVYLDGYKRIVELFEEWEDARDFARAQWKNSEDDGDDFINPWRIGIDTQIGIKIIR